MKKKRWQKRGKERGKRRGLGLRDEGKEKTKEKGTQEWGTVGREEERVVVAEEMIMKGDG